MLKGNVRSNAERVMKAGSHTEVFIKECLIDTHEAKSGINMTIPNVESAESVNDSEQAQVGSSATNTTITSASELIACDLLLLPKDTSEAAVIRAARMHEIGNATMMRYRIKNKS